MKANGAVLWRGASLLDGAPLVVIATGITAGSSNRKTGAMLQTYILREDISPTDAVRAGADVSICGECPHRGRDRDDGKPGKVARTCYVNVGQGPLGVWRAYKRGRYPDAVDPVDIGLSRVVRLGTYGDPAAVPTAMWQRLVLLSTGRTGYTHQWRKCDPALRTLCMASADSLEDAAAAHLAGWRTFRVSLGCEDAAPMKMESVCPASAEAGKKLTCAQCLACAGADGRRGSITIRGHGGFAVMANIRKHSEARPQRPYFAR